MNTWLVIGKSSRRNTDRAIAERSSRSATDANWPQGHLTWKLRSEHLHSFDAPDRNATIS
jgi:hypothetical protein